MNIEKWEERNHKITVIFAGLIVIFHIITYLQIAFGLTDLSHIIESYRQIRLFASLPDYGLIIIDWTIPVAAAGHLLYTFYNRRYRDKPPGADDLENYQ